MPPSPSRMQVTTNAGWLIVSHGAMAVRTGLIVFALTRYLAPAPFGRLMFAFSLTTLLAPLAQLGLELIVTRDTLQRPDEAGRIIHTATVMQLLGGILAAGVAVGCTIAIDPADSALHWLVIIASLSLLPRATQAIAYWFSARLQSRHVVAARVASLSVGIAFMVCLILLNAPLLAFAFIPVAEALTEAAMLIHRYLVARGAALSGWVAFDPAVARRLLRSSWPYLLGGAAIAIYMHIDQIMLKVLLGSEGDAAVGTYAPAVQVFGLLGAIGVAVSTSLFPGMITAHARNPEHLRQIMQRLYDWGTWSGIATAAAISLAAPPLLSLALGPGYRATGFYLTILVWGLPFVHQGLLQMRWASLEQQQHRVQSWLALSCIVNIALNAVLIPRYGGTGAAIATVVTQAATMLLGPVMFRPTRAYAAAAGMAMIAPVRWCVQPQRQPHA